MRFVPALVFLLSVYVVNGFIPTERLHALSHELGFSFGNCGSSSNKIQLKSMDVHPDPIKIPGNETIGMSVAISAALPTDIHASLDLQKRVNPFWVKVPCKDDVGSCTYGDFCAKWSGICQKYFAQYGFPCQCPIPAGTYNVPGALVDFTKKLPSDAQGEFKLEMKIGSSEGDLGCFDFHFNLKNG